MKIYIFAFAYWLWWKRNSQYMKVSFKKAMNESRIICKLNKKKDVAYMIYCYYNSHNIRVVEDTYI